MCSCSICDVNRILFTRFATLKCHYNTFEIYNTVKCCCFSSYVDCVSVSLVVFPQVKNWVKELRKMLGNEICLCIVGELLHHRPIPSFLTAPHAM